MNSKSTWLKIGLISGILVGITLFHYLTAPYEVEHHAVHRRLYYLPLVLASFWFGIKGAAVVSLSTIAIYFPFEIQRWRGDFHNFDTLLEAGLFVFVALTLGYLSERERKAHAARVEAEKLAAIGKAVSEIAHDMKSPLVAIGGFANQVSRKLSGDESSQKKLEVVLQETKKLEEMVKDMLEFGRPLELHRSRASLNDLVTETLEVAKPIAGKAGVELKTDLDKSLPLLELDVSRMEKVLMNLVVNAIEASESHKEVMVRTRSSKLQGLLEIEDQGHGIPEEDRENVFQPFFSRKKGGTGLGLANVKKIVEAHGGKITFHSKANQGTTFVISLPAQ